MALAQEPGVNPDYIRIGADALQVVMLWKAAKLNRQSGCFAAGTQVVTGTNADGSLLTKNIEDVREGDYVVSRHQSDAADELDLRRVTQVFQHMVDALRVLRIQGDDGNLETIRTTDIHSFYVEGQGWTVAGELKVGDRVQESDGSWQNVLGSTIEAHPEGIMVYNFTVEGDHTYFVEDGLGETDAVWVHNDCSVPDTDNVTRNAALNAVKRSWNVPRAARPIEVVQPGSQEFFDFGLTYEENGFLYKYKNVYNQDIWIREDYGSAALKQVDHFNAGLAPQVDQAMNLPSHHFYLDGDW